MFPPTISNDAKFADGVRKTQHGSGAAPAAESGRSREKCSSAKRPASTRLDQPAVHGFKSGGMAAQKRRL